MDISPWSLAQVLCKLFIYGGIAAAIGPPFVSRLNQSSPEFTSFIRRFSLILLSSGFIAALLLFFLQVGALADRGLMSMGDELMRSILWRTRAGPSLILQLMGFAFGWLLVFLFIGQPQGNVLSRAIALLIYCLSFACLVVSLAIVGHTAELSALLQIVIAFHVGLMAWWLGCLAPLRKACLCLPAPTLFSVMNNFSRCAMALVAVLLVSGGILAWQLFAGWQALLATRYGWIFIGKISLVVLILLVAARNKFQLTPRLLNSEATDARGKLATTILVEIAIALGILLVTAALTTLSGPEH